MLTIIRIIDSRENYQSIDFKAINLINVYLYSKKFKIKKDRDSISIFVKGDPGFVRLFGIASLLSEDQLVGYISEENLSYIHNIVDMCDRFKWENQLFSISLAPFCIPRLLYSKKYGQIKKKWEEGTMEKDTRIPFFNSECFILSKNKFFRLKGFSKKFFPDLLHEVDLSIRAIKKGFSNQIFQLDGVSIKNNKKRLFDSFYKEKTAMTLNFKYLSKKDKIKNLAFTLKETPTLLKEKNFQEVTGRFAGMVKNAVNVDE